MAEVRESDIEAYLLKQLKFEGGECRKVKWLGRSSAPDRRVMLPYSKTRLSDPCWVELKRPGEKPTAAQYREHTRMRILGETVYVIDTFQKVDQLISNGYV